MKTETSYKRRIIPLIISTLFILTLLTSFGAVTLVDLLCEYRVNPLGIDNVKPRLSWKIVDTENSRGQKQTGYQVLVASSVEMLNRNVGDIWASKMMPESESVNNVYAGAPLKSGQQCFWKVRVKDAAGMVSDWSKPAHFSMGLLNPKDWKGEWILKKDQLKTEHNWYRKNFTLSAKATSGFVYVASFGYHELYVNGEKVTNHVMNPVSSYMKKRIPYLTYDISNYLKAGDNVIAVWHAAGWARWTRLREYRNFPFVFKAQAEIVTNKEQISLYSDTSWKCKKSYSQYYGKWDILNFGGEIIDDRLREDDWNTVAYDDSNWMNASVFDAQELNAKIPEGDNICIALNSSKNRTMRAEYRDINVELSAQMVEPQVRYKALSPIAVVENQDGTYCIDMGENYTGFFEMNLYNGEEGQSVFFEIADQEGETSTWNQKSQYIYGKSGKGHFSNRFNLAGGRWITVFGLSYKPDVADIKGYVVTSNRKQISKFKSSSDLLNQIYQINLNTYLANTMDGILVDCPHRERRGWGEVTVAAMYGDALPNFESGAYMEQYFQMQRDAQDRQGRIRAVINEEDRPFLMWKANSPVTVWEAYKMLGDKKLLSDNYDSMKKWMKWLYENSNFDTGGALIIGKQGLREFPGLGDWCTPRGNFWSSSNSPDAAHFNNCVYAYMLECAKNSATALGKTKDAAIYAERLKVQQKAVHKLSYNPETGKYLDGKQVDQAFALLSGVTPALEKEKVSAQLIDNMLYSFPYYDTGSSGQALYTRYFVENGERMDLVYELLSDTCHPSYGYFIDQGKTVWPERWSAVGNSQIHTCYTGIGAYFIKGFGGIRPSLTDSGMRNFIIKPSPVGDLTFANTEFESTYGNIVVNWKRNTETASYHIEVPPNTTATVYLPAIGKMAVNEGGVLAEKAAGVKFVGTEKSDAVGNYVIYKVASGIYDFSVAKVPVTKLPDPLYKGPNLSLIGRMNASSMYIENEKLPGFEAFKANDEDPKTCWQAGDVNDQWLEVEWVKPQTFSKVVINEVGNEIMQYNVQAWDGGRWKDLASGKTCGSEKMHTFDAISAMKCRVLIVEAAKAVSISELQIIKPN